MSLKPKDNKLNIKIITPNYNFDLNIWQSSDRMLTFFFYLTSDLNERGIPSVTTINSNQSQWQSCHCIENKLRPFLSPAWCQWKSMPFSISNILWALWFFIGILGACKHRLGRSEHISHLALMAPQGSENGASLKSGANTNIQELTDENRPQPSYCVAQAAMSWMRNIL